MSNYRGRGKEQGFYLLFLLSPFTYCVFPKSIHAVTPKEFLLKIEVFIFAFPLLEDFLESVRNNTLK